MRFSLCVYIYIYHMVIGMPIINKTKKNINRSFGVCCMVEILIQIDFLKKLMDLHGNTFFTKNNLFSHYTEHVNRPKLR